MSKAKRTTPIWKISSETVKRVSRLSQIPYEPLGKWIPAGSGNFEKTKIDGRYRSNCNRVSIELACPNGHDSGKKIRMHCNKFDCSSCFPSACSLKARRINERLRAFRDHCYKNRVSIGKILHVSIAISGEESCFTDEEMYRNFKRHVVYPMLRKLGLVGGVLLLHLWSYYCRACGKKYKATPTENASYCCCKDPILTQKLNVHYHVLGFGNLLPAKEFRTLYPNYAYRNHLPRRSEAYYTSFYILSKMALWRNPNGSLKKTYSYFGYLHPSKFSIQSRRKGSLAERCPRCQSPRVVEKLEGKKVDYLWVYKARKWEVRYRLKEVEKLRGIIENLYKKFDQGEGKS